MLASLSQVIYELFGYSVKYLYFDDCLFLSFFNSLKLRICCLILFLLWHYLDLFDRHRTICISTRQRPFNCIDGLIVLELLFIFSRVGIIEFVDKIVLFWNIDILRILNNSFLYFLIWSKFEWVQFIILKVERDWLIHRLFKTYIPYGRRTILGASYQWLAIWWELY